MKRGSNPHASRGNKKRNTHKQVKEITTPEAEKKSPNRPKKRVSKIDSQKGVGQVNDLSEIKQRYAARFSSGVSSEVGEGEITAVDFDDKKGQRTG